MQHDGLRATRRRRFCVTTDSRHPWPISPNLVARRFRPTQPNRVWAADVTYLSTREGWLYLAVVLDLYSRRVVGWAMRDALDTALVSAALRMAAGRRCPEAGAIHHSDQGRPYASAAYQQLLAQHGMRASMSRRGNCWDNAPVESFFSSLKRELRATWPTRALAAAEVAAYIETFYNARRLHSTLQYQSPNAYEAAAVM